MSDSSSNTFVTSGDSTCTPLAGQPTASAQEWPPNYLDIFTPYELLLMYGGYGRGAGHLSKSASQVLAARVLVAVLKTAPQLGLWFADVEQALIAASKLPRTGPATAVRAACNVISAALRDTAPAKEDVREFLAGYDKELADSLVLLPCRDPGAAQPMPRSTDIGWPY